MPPDKYSTLKELTDGEKKKNDEYKFMSGREINDLKKTP